MVHCCQAERMEEGIVNQLRTLEANLVKRSSKCVSE